MLENGVVGRIFGPKREEVVGGWRMLHNEELHNLYASSNIVSAISEKGGACSTHEGDEKFVQNFGQ
jgi:hypothetical protein